MRDWSDDQEGPDPDYGPDLSNPRPPRSLSQRDMDEMRRNRERKERERRVSSDFNRHMIDLFNRRS